MRISSGIVGYSYLVAVKMKKMNPNRDKTTDNWEILNKNKAMNLQNKKKGRESQDVTHHP